MAQNLAKVYIEAENRTGPAIGAAKRGFESLEGSILNLKGSVTSMVAGALSIGSIVGVLTKVGRAAIEAEEAQARLETTLKATGGTAGLTLRELNDLADEMAGATPFDDESLRNASAQLLKFGNIQEDVFRRALKASADFAAFMGTDVVSASHLVGTALASPAEAAGRLERQIGKLTYAEETMIKEFVAAGDVISAQGVLLDILNRKIGGAAQLMNTGLNGALRDATKQFGELLEEIGKTEVVGGRLERMLAGAASLFRDLKNEIAGVPTALRALNIEVADFAAKFPILGRGLVKQVQESGRTASGRISGLPDPGAEGARAAAEQKRIEAFWDAEAKRGDEIDKKLRAEQEARGKKAAEDAKRAASEFAQLQARAAPRPMDAEFESLEKFWAKVAAQITEAEKAEARFLELQAKMAPPPLDAEFEDLERFWAKVAIDTTEAEKAARRSEEAFRDLGLTMVSAMEDYLFGVNEAVKATDLLKAALLDIGKVFYRELVTKPIMENVQKAASGFDLGGIFGKIFGGGGGGGVAPSLTGGGIVGFGSGGSFTVGGPGGTDQTPVGFMATRGEKVTVTPPGRGGEGLTVHAPITVMAPGVYDSRGLQAILAPILPGAITQAVADARLRGGQFATVMGR